jgi:hypothetical protein
MPEKIISDILQFLRIFSQVVNQRKPDRSLMFRARQEAGYDFSLNFIIFVLNAKSHFPQFQSELEAVNYPGLKPN